MSTVAFLSIAQKWWYDHDPSLPNTHAQHALFHALNQVTLAHVGIVCFVARETKGDGIKSYSHTYKQLIGVSRAVGYQR